MCTLFVCCCKIYEHYFLCFNSYNYCRRSPRTLFLHFRARLVEIEHFFRRGYTTVAILQARIDSVDIDIPGTSTHLSLPLPPTLLRPPAHHTSEGEPLDWLIFHRSAYAGHWNWLTGCRLKDACKRGNNQYVDGATNAQWHHRWFPPTRTMSGRVSVCVCMCVLAALTTRQSGFCRNCWRPVQCILLRLSGSSGRSNRIGPVGSNSGA